MRHHNSSLSTLTALKDLGTGVVNPGLEKCDDAHDISITAAHQPLSCVLYSRSRLQSMIYSDQSFYSVISVSF